MNKLIENYINNMKISDIETFASKNNILLNIAEVTYLYNLIKEKYKNILAGDTTIFKNIKANVNDDAYRKIMNLYDEYKKYL